MQVGKIQTQAQFNRNSESLFLLKRSDNSSTCGSVQVNFSPVTANESANNSLDVQKEVLKSFPIFNADRRFYTPCFILEVDKLRYTQNASVYYSLHQKKIDELCQQKAMIFVPKPSKNCSFCCICKAFFDDYLTHVTNPQHKTAVLKSEFTSQISALCQKYCLKTETGKSEDKIKEMNSKHKKIKKATSQKAQKQKPSKASKSGKSSR